jgi:hypothetical protein
MTREERRRCSALVVRPKPWRMEAREALGGAPPGNPSREDGRLLSTALPRTPGRCGPLPLHGHEQRHATKFDLSVRGGVCCKKSCLQIKASSASVCNPG